MKIMSGILMWSDKESDSLKWLVSQDIPGMITSYQTNHRMQGFLQYLPKISSKNREIPVLTLSKTRLDRW